MLTFYHAPQSRSSAVLTLIDEMEIGDWVETRIVTIPRMDGTGGRDATNPHPEGKVPCLVHDREVITERAAIMLHLTTLFPDSGLAPRPGTAAWGRFATWMAWYQGVLEPVLILDAAGQSQPWLTASICGVAEATARLHAALEKGPWLMGDSYSAADLLVHTPYAWFKDATPDDPLIQDWVARCITRPARARAMAQDAMLMARAA